MAIEYRKYRLCKAIRIFGISFRQLVKPETNNNHPFLDGCLFFILHCSALVIIRPVYAFDEDFAVINIVGQC
jgi:uncharacterized membrane protein YwaF